MKNITPTTPYTPINDQSATTFVCGTPSLFYDRIKLANLEHISGYLRNSKGNTIGYWSHTDKCYETLLNSQKGCVHPMGTYFTNCASNSLLTLLPTRNMFYHLSLISILKSDLIQMLLQEKKLFILAQDFETIVIWGRETGIGEQLFNFKIQAFILELRSLHAIYNEIVKRYRDVLYKFINQFDIFYELNEETSIAFSKLKTFINSGRYNFDNTTNTMTTTETTTKEQTSCFETLKNDLILEGVTTKPFHLVASFCGSIEFIDRHNSILAQLMDIIENRFSVYQQVNEQLVTLLMLSGAVVQESEFDFLDEFSQPLSNQIFSNPDAFLDISFDYSILSTNNETRTFSFTPNEVKVEVVDPTLRNRPSTVFHFDSQLQGNVFNLMPLINSYSWTRDSSIESDYKDLLKSLSSSSRSVKRELNILPTIMNINTIQSNGFTWKRNNLRTTPSPTFNCEKGRYGPNCKLCNPGTYSPGDGLLYVCNNGPINQVTYTRSGEFSENCEFKCRDSKKYRVGNTCQSIPIGFYSKDSGGEDLAECTLKGNSFGILDETLQHEHLVIISSGSHGSESSCQTALKNILAIPSSTIKSLLDNSFTISLNVRITDFSQFNFALKNYIIGYGIVSFSDWVLQMNFDSTSPSFNSIYMQVKKVNSTETFLITTSFPFDTNWHLITLQYDHPNKIMTLFRDGSLIGTCLFSMSKNSPGSSLIIGGFVDFLLPNPVMYFPGMIADFKLYEGLYGNELLIDKYFIQQPCFETSISYGNGKCLSLSCPNWRMVQEPLTSSCSCLFGRYFNEETSNCQACPFESTTGSILPRTSSKDCQCLPDYIFSQRYGECVLAKPSLSPPTSTFHFSNSLGSYKELESSFLSQRYYPLGEMEISFEPIEMENNFLINTTWSLDDVYIYNVKLIFNNTKVLWSYSMNEQELKQFTYKANMTGDFDLIMSTDCDSHRAGLQYKTTFHIRERDLKPLIKPKPSDSEFHSPFQVRLLQPYKTKQSIVILCYGREELNMTCVEYNEKQSYVFGPPLFLNTFSYGPNFQRLPSPIISYYYERTYSAEQLSYIENQNAWNEKLARKQEILKENEAKKKASVLYQVFNPFIEWFLTYPNYLWFPIVSAIVTLIYVAFLLALRLYIARRINRKKKEKIKHYLKEKKNMEEYLKNFLPPPLREKGFDDDEEEDEESESDVNESSNDEDNSQEETGSSDDHEDSEEDEEDDETEHLQDSSDSEPEPLFKKDKMSIPKREKTRVVINENNKDQPHPRNIPPPHRPSIHSSAVRMTKYSRFKDESLDNVDIQLQNIGASRVRNSNKTTKPLPSIPPPSQSVNKNSTKLANESNDSDKNLSRKKALPKKENQCTPKYLMCGDCGGIARFWCKRCSKYMCIKCNQKDNSQLHESCKSKVMVCDFCTQPRSELREMFLKGSAQMKMFACKLCLEELYEERKVNRVGAVLKRCTKCMDEEISKSQPEKKMCDNCIYFN